MTVRRPHQVRRGSRQARSRAASIRRPATSSAPTEGGSQVIHRNGLREELGNGRYRMKDAKGRTIVDRRATNKDSTRMRDLRSAVRLPQPYALLSPPLLVGEVAQHHCRLGAVAHFQLGQDAAHMMLDGLFVQIELSPMRLLLSPSATRARISRSRVLSSASGLACEAVDSADSSRADNVGET